MRVGQIMHKDPVIIAPSKRIGQALKLMQKHNIRHLPVIKDDRMVGWITSRILRGVVLVSMLGLLRSSPRLDLLLEDKPAVLEEVSGLVEKAGGKIINIALGTTKGDKRCYLFRLKKCDLTPIINDLKKHGHQVVDFIA